MAEAARKKMTLAEFLRWDDGSGSRYELVDGEVVAMAPPASRHSVIAGNVAISIGKRLRVPCRVAVEAGILLPHRNDTWYQADLAVTCSPQRDDPYVYEPRVIVEVMSPSTHDLDLLEKLPDYLMLATVVDVVYVSATERVVRYWHGPTARPRMPHVFRSGAVALQAFDIQLPLDEIYDGTGL